MNTKTEPFDRKSIFVNPRLISNGVKKLLGFLKERARGILYAGTFVSLADYTQSYKLSSLYNSNQDLPTYRGARQSLRLRCHQDNRRDRILAPQRQPLTAPRRELRGFFQGV